MSYLIPFYIEYVGWTMQIAQNTEQAKLNLLTGAWRSEIYIISTSLEKFGLMGSRND